MMFSAARGPSGETPPSPGSDEPQRRGRRGFRRSRLLRTVGAVGAFFAGPLPSRTAPAPLHVLLMGPDREATTELAPLHAALTKASGLESTLLPREGGPQASSLLNTLRDADAAIFFRGPGAVDDADALIVREFLRSGKGLIVLTAAADAWPSEPKFQAEFLGATSEKLFANGVPMSVINLFPHPILTGVDRFETNQPIPLFAQLAEDAQMIMEGTVGEATAPMAWVRRRPSGRIVHVVPAAFSDPAYQRLVVNAVFWAAGRPVPGARATVQRTFMPDAHPGAFAITLPNGPGLCLDPVRGGINYIWEGDFVDLRPRWLTKQGEPARIFGEIYYREKEWQPLRAGAPEREPDFQFRGYTLQDGYPEFHYDVGGREVYERLTPGADGRGLRRHFRVGPGTDPLWLKLEPQSRAEVTVRGLERDGNLATFTSVAGGEFTIEIRRKMVAAP